MKAIKWRKAIKNCCSFYGFDIRLSQHIEISNIVNSKYFHYKITREKFEPEPEFASGFLARRSTTSAILILMPTHVQISLLRRMPLFTRRCGRDTICHLIHICICICISLLAIRITMSSWHRQYTSFNR